LISKNSQVNKRGRYNKNATRATTNQHLSISILFYAAGNKPARENASKVEKIAESAANTPVTLTCQGSRNKPARLKNLPYPFHN